METADIQLNPTVEKSFEKQLFSTPIYTFIDKEIKDIKEDFFKLTQDRLSENRTIDIINEDHPAIEHIRNTVFAVANQLPEFSGDKVPVIIGSNLMFQQLQDHIPLHAYEHIPLVFSFILSADDYTPRTYFADPRGGVQTMNRNRIQFGIVETSFVIIASEGEINVTPGYLQRYTETNLSKGAYVTLDVLVGFNS